MTDADDANEAHDVTELRPALRAGVALFNAGEYHAAHDPWEERWLPLEAGTDDERLLHGLIQFTAAVHHARERNWSGATGLAESAADYLRALPEDHCGISIPDVRRFLRRLAVDPEIVERGRPPELRHGGAAVDLADLDLPAATHAAEALAEEYDRYDETVVADAVRYADAERGTGRARWATLVTDFVADEARRDLVYGRLDEHVAERRTKEDDVEGLF